jgi:hypothetical protein
MRIARFGILGALVLGAVGCQTDDGGPTSPNIPPLAFVRYINAVPDTNNITVRFINQVDFVPLTISNVPYRGVNQGGYQGTEAGSQRFRAFRYDPNVGSGTGVGATTALLADTTFTFVAGNYYTILHAGYARAGQIPAQKMYILDDGLPAANTNVSVRVVHAAIGLGAGVSNLDAFATADTLTALAGAPAFANLAYATASTFAALPTGQVAVQMAATGTTTRLAAGSRAPAGVVGTALVDPIAGFNAQGSVLTAVLFGPVVGGSPAATATGNAGVPPATAPTVVWFSDRQPPRTTP